MSIGASSIGSRAIAQSPRIVSTKVAPQISLVGASANAVASGTITINLPAGIMPGDTSFLYVVNQTQGTGTISTPAGWTLLEGTTSSTNNAVAAFRRTYQAGDPTSVTVTTNGTSTAAWIQALRNAGPMTAVAISTVAFSNQPPAVSVTPTASGSWLLYGMAMGNQGATMTSPAGMTQPTEISTGGNSATSFASIGGGYQGPVPTSAQTRQGTSSTGGAIDAILMAIEPAAAAMADTTLAGAASASGIGAGSLNTAITLASAASGSGIAAAALMTAIALTGAATGNGTASGSMSTSIAAAGAASGTGTGSGALTTAIRLAGSTNATGTASGALSTQITLSGSATGTGIASAAFAQVLTLSGAAAGAGTAAGSLLTAIPVSAAAMGIGTAAGNLSTQISLSGAAVGAGSATAALTTAIRLAGPASATATAAGTLNTAVTLAGTASGTGIGAASLTTSIRLSGAAMGTGTATGAFAGQAMMLAGAATGTGTGSASLLTAIRLAAAASGSAASTATLSTAIRFNGSATGSGSAAATLAYGQMALTVDPARIFYARVPPSLFTAAGPPRAFRAAALATVFPAHSPPQQFAAREPARFFEASTTMTIQHTTKDPSVDVDLTVDFTGVLPSGATLTSYDVTASSGSISNKSATGLRVIGRLSGGALNEMIEVKFIATPNSGAPRCSTVAVRVATIYAQQPTA